MDISTDLRQIIHALSDMLDLVGIDEFQHSKRVAYMAVETGRLLGLDEDTVSTLYHAGLLHDCGVSSSREHRALISELDCENSHVHCERGYDLLRDQVLFAELAPLVRLHHSHWLDLHEQGVDDRIALLSNCIYMVDRVDSLLSRHKPHEMLRVRAEVCAIIEKFKGNYFAPSLVETLLELGDRESFWLSMLPHNLSRTIDEFGDILQPETIDEQSLYKISALIANIIDAKTPFTAEHSHGVSRLAKYLGESMRLEKSVCEKLAIAGLLHDMGKLVIPDEILEKTGPLTSAEVAVMQGHSFETYQILRKINGMEDVCRWASYHHERLSGDGYPFRLDAESLSIEPRIITVADIFQALTQKRPYRNPMNPANTMKALQNMALHNKIDQDVVNVVQENLGVCWHLATGDSGFAPETVVH